MVVLWSQILQRANDKKAKWQLLQCTVLISVTLLLTTIPNLLPSFTEAFSAQSPTKDSPWISALKGISSNSGLTTLRNIQLKDSDWQYHSKFPFTLCSCKPVPGAVTSDHYCWLQRLTGYSSMLNKQKSLLKQSNLLCLSSPFPFNTINHSQTQSYLLTGH